MSLAMAALPALAQQNDKEYADPKPAPAEAWQGVKKISLGWGDIDTRYQRNAVPKLEKALSLYAWKGERVNAQAVLMAPQAQPPVCKIMDYGKYRFEQTKREKEAKKNQHVVEIKEVRLSLGIDTHDFETKANHAKRFLTSGNKVKVSIRFRGREMAHTESGLTIMQQFAEACAEFGNIEKAAKLEGKSMMMFLAPKPKK